MNDQLLMDIYLLLLKSTVEVYVHGTLESSNKDIKDLLKHGLDETMLHQERTYNEMIERNWYTVENVKTNAISQVLSKVQSN